MSEIEAAGDSSDRGQRDGHGRFLRGLDVVKKDALAAELRAHGYPLREIATKLGYANESGASKAIARGLAAVPVEAVEELRALESARLDVLEERTWKVLNTRWPYEVAGRMLYDQEDKPVGNPVVALGAIDRLLRISAQRAKLLGLNASKPQEPEPPKPADLELTGPQIELLRRLVAELAPADSTPAWRELPMAAEKPREAA